MALRIHDNVVRGEIDNRLMAAARQELFKMREGILQLMDELAASLGTKSDTLEAPRFL